MALRIVMVLSIRHYWSIPCKCYQQTEDRLFCATIRKSVQTQELFNISPLNMKMLFLLFFFYRVHLYCFEMSLLELFCMSHRSVIRRVYHFCSVFDRSNDKYKEDGKIEKKNLFSRNLYSLIFWIKWC